MSRKARCLTLAGVEDGLAGVRGGGERVRIQYVGVVLAYVREEVDAVEQRSAELAAVVGKLPGGATATPGEAGVSALARIGCGDEDETRWIDGGVLGGAIATWPSSKGWRRASSVGEANSASSSRNRTPWWARTISPTQPFPAPPIRPAVVTCVVGGTKRPFVLELVGHLLPLQVADAQDIDGFGLGERGHDRRQTLGEHGLASPRGAAEEGVVGAGRRDDQRAHSVVLAEHLGKIGGDCDGPLGRREGTAGSGSGEPPLSTRTALDSRSATATWTLWTRVASRAR